MTTALLIAAALTLPGPGNESRARGFCRPWLELSPGQKFALLARTDDAEAAGDALACRRARRAHAIERLDYECRNWRILMDFEVRHFLERAYAGCTPAP